MASKMVTAYTLKLAHSLVVCTVCAMDAYDETRSLDEQFVMTRRKDGWICPICEKGPKN